MRLSISLLFIEISGCQVNFNNIHVNDSIDVAILETLHRQNKEIMEGLVNNDVDIT